MKNSAAHLDHWFYASNRPSRAMIQILNFGEDEIVSMFYACDLFVICIISMLIIHPYSGNMMLVEAIMVSISRRGFYAVTKIIFVHPTTNFYVTSTPKTLLHILTIDSMHPISHQVSWFKFQILQRTRSPLHFTLAVSMFYALFSC